MADTNTVQLYGFLPYDVEKSDDGKETRFTLVVERKVVKGGTAYSDFIPIQAASSCALVAQQHLKKGMRCSVSGQLKTFAEGFVITAVKIKIGGITSSRNIVKMSGYVCSDLTEYKGFVQFTVRVNDLVYVNVSCAGLVAKDAKTLLKKNSKLTVSGALNTFGKEKWVLTANKIQVGA
jgi:Single-stranded DNA-binding protein